MSKVITAAKNGYKKKLDILLAEGHSVDSRDEKQATALFWGACRGHPSICVSLILAGADINARVNWGATPLHAAADTGHAECIKVLLKFQADINAQNNRGDTPLHLACYRGFTDVVSLLLNSGADVSLVNDQGKTPYVEADSQKHITVLKILQPQMNHLRERQKTTPQIRSLPLVQYSTDCIQNSLNISTFSGNNMRNISFVRTSEPQENEDRVGSLGETNCLSTDLNILNLDKQTDSVHSTSSSTTENTSQYLSSWLTESVDCKKPEQRQVDGKIFQSEMQRMRRSLNAQNCLIQKLREENEKLKEMSELREAERIRADNSCRQIALQIARLKQQPTFLWSVSDDSVSNFSSSSDLSASPDQIASPNCLFSSPKYPSASGPATSSLNVDCVSTSHRNFSHQSVLELYQQVPDWKLLDFDLLTKKVSDVWLHVSKDSMKLDQNDQGEWLLGHNYELRDNSPLNRSIENQGNGTCSLVFRIRYKNQNLILKMMTNLIDLHEHGHNQGHSLNDSLQFRFGAELTPTKVPPHRNLIKIIHHYSGTTFNFQKFHHLVAPPGLQGIEMAHQTLFFVMPEYPKSLKTFMENTSFNSSLEKFLLQQLYQLLSAIYLLEKMHIVHRDIKPDNIFLDCRLRPILADFGFAKRLRDLDMKIPVTHLGQIEAANNLAWTPEMIRWKTSVYPFTNLAEEDVYKFTDSYSVGKMFYGFLTTEDQKFPEVTGIKPYYSKEELPHLPSFLSAGLCYVLQRLVLDQPSDRLTTRQAMLWTGLLLSPPSPEEMTHKLMAKHYLQAKLMTLLVLKPTVFQSDDQSLLTVEESIQQNAQTLEADFLCNVTVDEFWDIYQTISLLNSDQTNLNNLS